MKLRHVGGQVGNQVDMGRSVDKVEVDQQVGKVRKSRYSYLGEGGQYERYLGRCQTYLRKDIIVILTRQINAHLREFWCGWEMENQIPKQEGT